MLSSLLTELPPLLLLLVLTIKQQTTDNHSRDMWSRCK